ncbi:alpha/beta fold hydrolase [Chryseomicrobium aureum]|uniref:alpha/beta fold hydrolase n=1 Tax=Chryseomicrobium aureum TaxID=1441723 RepID=UPI00370D0EA5
MWKRQIIKTDRGTFEIFRKGQGAPLCVTHHYSVFNESGDYFAESFTDTHEVFLMNLRECGESEKANESYHLSMLETVFDLESIRKALEIEKWVYAGHSTGGMLGVIYGIYFSDSLLFNVIVGAAARDYFTFSKQCIYHSEHPKYEKMQMLLSHLMRPELSQKEKEMLKVERTKLSLYRPENHDEYFSKNISKQISAKRLEFFNREVQIFDVTKKLKLITCPVLIICGEHDVQCPIEYSLEMHELIPNSKFLGMNYSNHYPFLEEAALFKKEVFNFVTQLGA